MNGYFSGLRLEIEEALIIIFSKRNTVDLAGGFGLPAARNLLCRPQKRMSR